MATQSQVHTAAAQKELGIVPDYRTAGVSKKIVAAAMKQVAVNTQIKKLKAELDDLNGEIGVEMAKAGASAVMVGVYRVNLIDSSNSTLNKEKLLECGVPAETIVECTVKTAYSYVTVTDTEKAAIGRKEKKAGVKPISKRKR